MTPAPVVAAGVAAAGAAKVVERGPTWSSELRSWIPTLLIGLVLLFALLAGLIWGASSLLSYYNGQCEEQGYDTIVDCALGSGPLGDVVSAGSGVVTSILLFPLGGKKGVKSSVLSWRRLRGRFREGFIRPRL